MNGFKINDDSEWAAMAKEVRDSSLPEVEKLARAFGWVTARIVAYAEREVEAARALRDEESAIKQQVKMETVRHARSIFEECYLLATGRKAWDE